MLSSYNDDTTLPTVSNDVVDGQIIDEEIATELAEKDSNLDDLSGKIAILSIVDPVDGTFTTEELTAIADVRSKLLLDGFPNEKISLPELALTTINCKLRVDNAVAKYKKWMECLSGFGLNTFDEVWSDVNRDGSGDWDKIRSDFSHYARCGKDSHGRSIMWIKARAIPVEDE
eukprot:gene38333-50318_t